jgi:hypothetical protein
LHTKPPCAWQRRSCLRDIPAARRGIAVGLAPVLKFLFEVRHDDVAMMFRQEP